MAGATIDRGSGRHGRTHRRRSGYRPMADINVTPMVDVMLVLLIVFMVAAPLLTVGVPVDLPKTEAKSLNDQSEVLSVAIKSDGQIYINDNPTAVTDDDLVPKLQAIVQAKP